jgi:hypothetical protein
MRVLTVTEMPGRGNPATCGLPLSSSCWTSASGRASSNSAFVISPLMLAAGMPDPAMAVSNVIGTSSPAFGERGPVTTRTAFAPR